MPRKLEFCSRPLSHKFLHLVPSRILRIEQRWRRAELCAINPLGLEPTFVDTNRQVARLVINFEGPSSRRGKCCDGPFGDTFLRDPICAFPLTDPPNDSVFTQQ